uniref:Xylanolytic transcriptional activator regulatory domain-containing protein n=1 Tax=Bionectria ochroleuca TaxID=29856 RepID=A0A0B7KDP7_BIOOC
MEEDRSGNQSITRPVILRRSCDQCRVRKAVTEHRLVRTALVLGLNAHTLLRSLELARAARECSYQQISGEKKIDEIAQNVDGIRQLLQALGIRAIPGAPSSTPRVHQGALHSETTSQNSRKTQAFDYDEGGSLFYAQSKLTGRFVSELIGFGPFSQPNANRNAIMESLQEILASGDENNLEGSETADVTMPGFSDSLELPPQEEAVIVLRWARENTPCYILFWLAQVLDIEQFADSCQRLYFPITNFSQLDFIIANSFLAWVFCEYGVVSGHQKYFGFGTQCQLNALNSISHLPLVLPPSSKTIASLVLGAQHAIDTNQPTLAWTLNSTAASMCQTLGYHRRSRMENHGEKAKTDNEKLFWSVYRLDKALSLRLGRTPVVVEYDVALPSEPTVRRWTKFADIQGRTYNQLYSCVASQKGEVERMEMAGALSVELQMLLDQQHKSSSTENVARQAQTDPRKSVHLQTERIIYLSVLTLICRMAPVTTGIFECIPYHAIDVARMALETHRQALDDLRSLTIVPSAFRSYINWTVHFVPFLPFIVVFCSVMHDCNIVDLARLEDFIANLSTGEGHPHSRACQLMKILSELARLYCEVNSSESIFDPETGTEEFDDFLDMLGIDRHQWDCLEEGELGGDRSDPTNISI